MKVSDTFTEGKTVLSFEVFPPKATSPIESVYKPLEQLCALNPAYISVTYGAAGGAKSHCCEIASRIKHVHGIEPVAHLTCVGNTAPEIQAVLDDFKANGIENILALRGDIVPGQPVCHDFKYASDLTLFIKEQNPEFDICGACYPEVHMESNSELEDILNLKKKVDAGASHLISQLFFDNQIYYNFLQKVRIAGINVPISAGIMPVVNKKQIERMVSLCGASLPPKFVKVMQKYGDNPEAMRDAGIAYAINQIVDLISNGVEGIHIYTMNNPYVATAICEGIKNLL